MEKTWKVFIDYPGFALLGLLLGAVGSFWSPKEALTFVFYWSIANAVLIGGYTMFWQISALVIMRRDRTPLGWNWEHSPSVQELKTIDPSSAQLLADLRDDNDRDIWKAFLIPTVLTFFMFGIQVLAALLLWWAGPTYWDEHRTQALVVALFWCSGIYLHYRTNR